MSLIHPWVTVLMRVYNTASYLLKAVDRQCFKLNFQEFWIVDC